MHEGVWQHAFSEQVRSRGRMLFTLAHRIVRDADEAEDVCQTAFTRAWAQRDRLREPGRLGAWLAQVVVNESLLRIRQRKREQRVLGERARQMTTSSRDTTPRAIEQVDLRDALLPAVTELTEPMRTIVVLRTVQGLSGNEVSELLGCSASEVSRRLHEGLEQLRGELKRLEFQVSSTTLR